MNFTEEEISLCKQVAKKHRKKIKYGDWFEFKDNVYLVTSSPEPEASYETIPLWTISNCLDFLRDRGWFYKLNFFDNRVTCYIYISPNRHLKSESETVLEACLKAVLAVLEETK